LATRKDIQTIHRQISREKEIGGRMRGIAEAWVGRPYIADSLIGGPDTPEKLVVRFDAFDCVTFVENVLALARSRSPDGFFRELRRTRYRDGRVSWSARLHYFSDWMRQNDKRKAIRIRSRGSGSRSIEASPGFIQGLPTRRVRFHVVPKQKIRLALDRIHAGSIVAFASVRSKLDFFHTGLLFCGEEPTLIHASRSARKVISEPLARFSGRNRMRGMAFAEPRPTGGAR
jgi:hypothetical protein